MASRTYVPSLLQVATLMCRLIGKASPVIAKLYPDNTALQAALAAALTACQVLSTELAKVRSYGD